MPLTRRKGSVGTICKVNVSVTAKSVDEIRRKCTDWTITVKMKAPNIKLIATELGAG